ncbi:hypothetical protein HDU98_008995 [Podochytrium sp. JEL0797]|nr:hypothetical protein HDU98_008995 [Podochytrium sp. JEL0797]
MRRSSNSMGSSQSGSPLPKLNTNANAANGSPRGSSSVEPPRVPSKEPFEHQQVEDNLVLSKTTVDILTSPISRFTPSHPNTEYSLPYVTPHSPLIIKMSFSNLADDHSLPPTPVRSLPATPDPPAIPARFIETPQPPPREEQAQYQHYQQPSHQYYQQQQHQYYQQQQPQVYRDRNLPQKPTTFDFANFLGSRAVSTPNPPVSVSRNEVPVKRMEPVTPVAQNTSLFSTLLRSVSPEPVARSPVPPPAKANVAPTPPGMGRRSMTVGPIVTRPFDSVPVTPAKPFTQVESAHPESPSLWWKMARTLSGSPSTASVAPVTPVVRNVERNQAEFSDRELAARHVSPVVAPAPSPAGLALRTSNKSFFSTKQRPASMIPPASPREPVTPSGVPARLEKRNVEVSPLSPMSPLDFTFDRWKMMVKSLAGTSTKNSYVHSSGAVGDGGESGSVKSPLASVDPAGAVVAKEGRRLDSVAVGPLVAVTQVQKEIAIAPKSAMTSSARSGVPKRESVVVHNAFGEDGDSGEEDSVVFDHGLAVETTRVVREVVVGRGVAEVSEGEGLMQFKEAVTIKNKLLALRGSTESFSVDGSERFDVRYLSRSESRLRSADSMASMDFDYSPPRHEKSDSVEPLSSVEVPSVEARGVEELGIVVESAAAANQVTESPLVVEEGAVGMEWLVNELSTSTDIFMLDLSEDDLSAEDVEMIAEMLRSNKTLETLVLERDDLSEESLLTLAAALGANRSLKELRIGSGVGSMRVDRAFAEAVEHNKTILSLGYTFQDATSRISVKHALARNAAGPLAVTLKEPTVEVVAAREFHAEENARTAEAPAPVVSVAATLKEPVVELVAAPEFHAEKNIQTAEAFAPAIPVASSLNEPTVDVASIPEFHAEENARPAEALSPVDRQHTFHAVFGPETNDSNTASKSVAVPQSEAVAAASLSQKFSSRLSGMFKSSRVEPEAVSYSSSDFSAVQSTVVGQDPPSFRKQRVLDDYAESQDAITWNTIEPASRGIPRSVASASETVFSASEARSEKRSDSLSVAETVIAPSPRAPVEFIAPASPPPRAVSTPQPASSPPQIHHPAPLSSFAAPPPPQGVYPPGTTPEQMALMQQQQQMALYYQQMQYYQYWQQGGGGNPAVHGSGSSIKSKNTHRASSSFSMYGSDSGSVYGIQPSDSASNYGDSEAVQSSDEWNKVFAVRPSFKNQKPNAWTRKRRAEVQLALMGLRASVGKAALRPDSKSSQRAMFEFGRFCIQDTLALDHGNRNELLGEAFEVLKRLCFRGNAESQHLLGKGYLEDGNYESAYILFYNASAQSHGPSCSQIASMVAAGKGCTKDEAAAVSYLQMGVFAGDTESAYKFGFAHAHGKLGLSCNFFEALRLFNECAKDSKSEFRCKALFEISRIYELGAPDLPRNEAISLSALNDAAKGGLLAAITKMAYCYEQGKLGLKVDRSKSRSLYQTAAELGDETAKMALMTRS